MVTAGHPLDTAHNPKVAGSNPAPATSEEDAVQRPFPVIRKGLWLVPVGLRVVSAEPPDRSQRPTFVLVRGGADARMNCDP